VFTGLESPIHLIIVLAVVLLVFGAKRVPELAKGLGEGVREFRKGAQGGEGEEDARGALDEREEDSDPR
jgi:sec-independent protein translocase protein TatA